MIGWRVGPYQILSKVGAGGMGEVYRARDAQLERDVALKVLPADAGADEMARARLLREARLASKLNHPHICTGRPADARSDLWALGVVLYELLVGQRPFQGETGFALSAAILNQPTPTVPASVPAALAGVIDRCLAKDPAARFQRADEVGAALEAAASGQAIAAPTPSPTSSPVRRGRGRARLLAVAGGIVLLAIVAALLVALDVGGLRSRLVGGSGAARIVKLAVLPFANVSGDAEQEYLSDGLTTEMIALLGRLHPETLHVIARTTAMRYKKTDKSIDQIGRELGVDYVLEGSAQREAGRIRITADLRSRWRTRRSCGLSGMSASWRASSCCRTTWRSRWRRPSRSSFSPQSRRGWRARGPSTRRCTTSSSRRGTRTTRPPPVSTPPSSTTSARWQRTPPRPWRTRDFRMSGCSGRSSATCPLARPDRKPRRSHSRRSSSTTRSDTGSSRMRSPMSTTTSPPPSASASAHSSSIPTHKVRRVDTRTS